MSTYYPMNISRLREGFREPAIKRELAVVRAADRRPPHRQREGRGILITELSLLSLTRSAGIGARRGCRCPPTSWRERL
jgi:hypothetical protein